MNLEFITLCQTNGSEIAINPDKMESFVENDHWFSIRMHSGATYSITKSSFFMNFHKGSDKTTPIRF